MVSILKVSVSGILLSILLNEMFKYDRCFHRGLQSEVCISLVSLHFPLNHKDNSIPNCHRNFENIHYSNPTQLTFLCTYFIRL